MTEAAPQKPSAETQFASAFLGGPQPQIVTEPPQQKAEDKPADAPQAPPTEDKPQELTPAEAPKGEGGAEEKSVEEKYLEAIGGNTEPPPPIDDAMKAALKARGVDDLDALLSERGTLAEQVSQFKNKAEQYDAVEKALKELPAEIGDAIEAFRNGKDYTKALIPLTKGISVSKDAKSIGKEALVDHYFPGKFTQEQKEAINDGDETLKEAFDKYAELAAIQHDKNREGYAASISQRAEQSKAFREREGQAIAAAIAHAKADPATSLLLTEELQGAFAKGTLIDSTFYESDGTPKKEGLALLAKALNHDKIVERAMKGAAAKAKVEGELAARERAPERPSKAPGEIKQPPQAPREGGDAELLKQADAALAKALAG